MAKRRKNVDTLGEHGIFGDEQAAKLAAELDELRAAVTDLSGRLHAQFTTIAAHAEIAREQADFARQEARSDLERTRQTLLGLIEQVRHESAPADHHAAGSEPGQPAAEHDERLNEIDARVEQLDQQVARCLERQNELADLVAATLDSVLAQPQGQPVSGLSLT